MPKKEVSIAELFLTFAKIGSMTFGGGYAMLPLIEREIIDNRRWADYKELMDLYIVAQATPGVIAVNAATLIGYRKRGLAGALAATAGVVLPSVIIITVIAAWLERIISHWAIAQIFAALQICVAALLINAVIPFLKRGIINLATGILFAAAFCGFYFFNISPAYIIILCAGLYLAYDAVGGGLK